MVSSFRTRYPPTIILTHSARKHMRPPSVLVIGNEAHHTWQLLWSAGVVVALMWSTVLCAAMQVPPAWMLAAAVLSGAAYTALVRVLAYLRGSVRHVLLSGLAVLLLVGGAVFWQAEVPLRSALDVMVGGFAVLMTFGRLGCWSSGCCAGATIHHGPAPSDQVRFPNQLIESGAWAVLGLAVLPLALGLEPGHASGVVGISYALLRFWLEGLRGDARPHLFGWSQARWTCLPLLIASLALLQPPPSTQGWVLLAAASVAAGALLLLRGRLFPPVLVLPEAALQAWAAAAAQSPAEVAVPPLLRPGLLVERVPTPKGTALRIRTAAGPVAPAVMGAVMRHVQRSAAQAPEADRETNPSTTQAPPAK